MTQLSFFQMLGMVSAALMAVVKFLPNLVNRSQKPAPLATVSWNG